MFRPFSKRESAKLALLTFDLNGQASIVTGVSAFMCVAVCNTHSLTYSWTTLLYDGSHLWILPSRAQGVVRVDVTTGDILNVYTANIAQNTDTKVDGATYDPSQGYIWTTPSQIAHVMRISTGKLSSTGTITKYTASGGANAFSSASGRVIGAAFDGRYHWMAPFTGDYLVGVDTSNPSNPMVTYHKSSWYTINGVITGLSTGDVNRWLCPVYTQDGVLYLIPNSAIGIVKVETQNGGALSAYADWPSQMDTVIASSLAGTAVHKFNRALYDGQYIWIAPRTADLYGPLRFDTSSGNFKYFGDVIPAGVTGANTGNPWGGIAFDPVDRTFWFSGFGASALLGFTVTSATPSASRSATK